MVNGWSEIQAWRARAKFAFEAAEDVHARNTALLVYGWCVAIALAQHQIMPTSQPREDVEQLLAELAAAEAALAPGTSPAAHHALRYRLMLSTHAQRLRPSEWVGGRAYPAERLSAAALEPAAGCLRSLLSLA